MNSVGFQIQCSGPNPLLGIFSLVIHQLEDSDATMGQMQCLLHCVPKSVPQCPDEGTDEGHHRFFLEFLTGFLPVETRVGSGGGEMHAGSLSNVLSGCRYDSSEAPPWLPR